MFRIPGLLPGVSSLSSGREYKDEYSHTKPDHEGLPKRNFNVLDSPHEELHGYHRNK